MIVNIIKLYGLPEKNHYKTDPSAFFSLLFFTDSWRSTLHDQISGELRIGTKKIEWTTVNIWISYVSGNNFDLSKSSYTYCITG